MPNRLLAVLLVALVAVPLSVLAQDAPKPPVPAAPVAGAEKKEKRRVDPAAMKLMEGVKKLSYSAVDAGLEKMSCTVGIGHDQLPFPVNFDVTFVAPDKTTVKMRDLPNEFAMAQPQMEQAFGGMVKNLIGEMPRGPFADLDDYHVEMKEGTTNTVVQTKYAADADVKRQEITFGEDNLPTKIVTTNDSPMGPQTMSFKPTFEKKGERYLMVSAEGSGSDGEMSLKSEYTQVGKFWVMSKMILSSMQGTVTLTATNIKVEPGGEVTEDSEEKDGE